MKHLHIALVTVFLILVSKTESRAQSYKNAIGIRVGNFNGLSFKTMTRENRSVDLNLAFNSSSDYSYVRFTGLYEFYSPTELTPGLFWYAGPGASIGSKRNKRLDSSNLLLSVNGVLGLDYKFASDPINLSLDWVPFLEVTPDAALDMGSLGLSIRYTF